MASYEIVFKRSVRKDLRRIDRLFIPTLLNCIDSLAVNPRPPGCKKLKASGVYRVRVGDFRKVYEIHDGKLVIVVIAVNKRSRAYHD